MTEALATRPSPAAALERVFRGVLHHQMQDMPLVNPALSVEAVGFRPWDGHWLGVLVTPWFMNLVLMPRVAGKWSPIRERESRHYVFPAGVFEFIGSQDPVLGDYQACSLFSPMFDFADHAAARDTAAAALDALFDGAHRPVGEVTGAAVPHDATPPEAKTSPAPAPLSKRAFLFGVPPRADRGR
jgi:[NiFe] hydrogenase assembly HybE family chaperone